MFISKTKGAVWCARSTSTRIYTCAMELPALLFLLHMPPALPKPAPEGWEEPRTDLGGGHMAGEAGEVPFHTCKYLHCWNKLLSAALDITHVVLRGRSSSRLPSPQCYDLRES